MACTYLKLKPLWNPSVPPSLAGVRGHDRRDGVDDVRGGVRGERGARAAAGGPQDGAQQEEGEEGQGRLQDQGQAAHEGPPGRRQRRQGPARLQVWPWVERSKRSLIELSMHGRLGNQVLYSLTGHS